MTRHDKLNQRHDKWIQFMKNFTFVIKHIAGNANKVVDALSRRCLILQEFQVKTLGFEHLKEMYCDDPVLKRHMKHVKILCLETGVSGWSI
jgi:hypothetical protein